MKLIVLGALLLTTASAAEPPVGTAPPAPPPAPQTMPNLLDKGAAHCRSIPVQIADENKRRAELGPRTLDREPRAHLLLAVDRQVNGCREVTFVRRNIGAPPALPAEPGR